MKKSAFVVYQMGKVASTSLIKTLAMIPNSDVHQCHFLSPDTFKRSLNKLLAPETSDYLYHHLSQQSFSNLEILRRVNVALREQGEEDIYVISVYRDPLEWTRSAIVQDMREYQPALLQLLDLAGKSYETSESGVGIALDEVLKYVSLALKGGIPVEQLGVVTLPEFKKTCGIKTVEEARIVARLAELFGRPHRWFFKEFETVLGTKISEMDKLSPTVFHKKIEGLNAYVLSYKDIESDFSIMVEHANLSTGLALRRDNLSEGKIHAESVGNAFFRSDVADEISRHPPSPYMRNFFQ